MSAAQWNDADRVAIIRERVRAGLLPGKPPVKVFASRAGTGQCSACGLSLERPEVVYEFQIEAQALRMHLSCFAAWTSELANLA